MTKRMFMICGHSSYGVQEAISRQLAHGFAESGWRVDSWYASENRPFPLPQEETLFFSLNSLTSPFLREADREISFYIDNPIHHPYTLSLPRKERKIICADQGHLPIVERASGYSAKFCPEGGIEQARKE